jgi:hypothetical protein
MLRFGLACTICGLLCLAPIVVHCEERKGMKAALTFMAVGQGLDTVTTIAALNRGAVEANGLYGRHPSTAKLVAAKLPMIGVGWLLTKVAPRHPRVAKGAAYVIGGVGVGLALHNSQQGRGR